MNERNDHTEINGSVVNINEKRNEKDKKRLWDFARETGVDIQKEIAAEAVADLATLVKTTLEGTKNLELAFQIGMKCIGFWYEIEKLILSCARADDFDEGTENEQNENMKDFKPISATFIPGGGTNRYGTFDAEEVSVAEKILAKLHPSLTYISPLDIAAIVRFYRQG